MAASSLTPLATKIWAKFETPLSSSQVTHGVGGLLGSPEPEKMNGSIAGFLMSWFRLGSPLPRSRPAGCQAFLAASKRAANSWVLPLALSSYHAAHGTLLSWPAKVIVGSCP